MNDQRPQAWPDWFSERFHIFALGESYDLDAFLAQWPLDPSFVWRRMGNGPTNGLELLLGDEKTIKLHEQEKICKSSQVIKSEQTEA
jgi:hypothetical protein